MNDARFTKLADLLIGYSVALEKGERWIGPRYRKICRRLETLLNSVRRGALEYTRRGVIAGHDVVQATNTALMRPPGTGGRRRPGARRRRPHDRR